MLRRALLTVLLLASAAYATRSLARSPTFELFGSAVASDCMRLPLKDLRRSVDRLFSGTVTRVTTYSGSRIVVDLDVDRVWKGRVSRRTTIYTWPAIMGGVKFEEGRRYVVAAPAYAIRLFTDPVRGELEPRDSPGCGWGWPYEVVEAELPSLGPSVPAR